MAFGRLVTGAGAQSYTLIRHKWITKIFVAGDVLSFFLQAGGKSLCSYTSSSFSVY